MSHLVTLKLGPGSFYEGFFVTLQIGGEGAQATTERTGVLPPDPELPQQLSAWQRLYRRLNFVGRPLGLPRSQQPAAEDEACRVAAAQLGDRLNQWLRTESFRSIRETWLEKLQPEALIRVLIQTGDFQLQQLPWHLWDLLERYPNAEVALSVPSFDRWSGQAVGRSPLQILAILGDSQGIDVGGDRQSLAQLPGAAVQFLVEPERSQLCDELWQQAWQVLFFAGHSVTAGAGNQGLFQINARETLSIGQLKYGLRNAVTNGLQLAIFNSCDGLGVARELADLQIPQMIVMREPVPDRVAQTFLTAFLAAYPRSASLYQAVRRARERLQEELDEQFPCASWLPVIFQNPAVVPPSWAELTGQPLVLTSGAEADRPRPWVRRPTRRGLAQGAAIAAATTVVTLGLRFLGVLQPVELLAYDQVLRLRPQEPPDGRLLIVTVTEADIGSQPGAAERRGSLSDQALLQLLQVLERDRARVIGLDIYRDFPALAKYPELRRRLQEMASLVATCRTQSEQSPGVAPPPEVSGDRLGFADTVPDGDGVLRRHLLALTPPPTSVCAASYSLSVQLVLRYLHDEGVALKFTPQGDWQLGAATVPMLQSRLGGYQGVDAWGFQTLLNYRSHRSIEGVAPQVTLAEVLAGRVNPEQIRDRIVLIGTIAPSFGDYTRTPFAGGSSLRGSPGVVLQAQMVSQLLSAALDGRGLIWSFPFWAETLWVGVWSGIGCGVGGLVVRRSGLVLGLGVAGGVLYGGCWWGLAIMGGWWPLVPGALGLVMGGMGSRVSGAHYHLQ